MKEVKHYICEICGTEYKSEDSCRKCEDSHIKPLEIVKQKYVSIGNDASGYPVWIEVKMSNGEVIRYKRRCGRISLLNDSQEVVTCEKKWLW